MGRHLPWQARSAHYDEASLQKVGVQSCQRLQQRRARARDGDAPMSDRKDLCAFRRRWRRIRRDDLVEALRANVSDLHKRLNPKALRGVEVSGA